MKYIKTAKVEPVCPNDLNVGDAVLWGIFKTKVIKIIKHSFSFGYSMHPTQVTLQRDWNNERSVMAPSSYRTYNRIIECEEYNGCVWCSKELPDGQNVCPDCLGQMDVSTIGEEE